MSGQCDFALLDKAGPLLITLQREEGSPGLVKEEQQGLESFSLEHLDLNPTKTCCRQFTELAAGLWLCHLTRTAYLTV